MMSSWKWLFICVVSLLLTNNKAERCRSTSFSNAQLIAYNTNRLSASVAVSGCISSSSLKAIGGNVRRILFDNQNVPHLRVQAVSNLAHLETLRFVNSGITTISTGAFWNLPLLENVYLTHNQIDSLNEHIFMSIPKLRILSLHQNNLQQFDRQWLGNVTDLRILDLSYNAIEFIARDAFVNLKKLEILYLEHNNIRQITERAFDDLENLDTIDLSYNKISRLYDNLFASTTKLERLNLFGNSLTYISEKVLRTLRSLDELIISYNPWQCKCYDKIINWMYKYPNVKINSASFKCEETTDLSNIASCVTYNATQCVPTPGEDLLTLLLSKQDDYRCSWIKPYTQIKERDDPCTVPNGKPGKCVPYDTCQVVFDAAISLKKENKEFVKATFCGHDTEALVCCESPGPVITADFETPKLPNRASCGTLLDEPRIVGGIVADLGEFPWMVGLNYKYRPDNSSVGIRCGGSIINNKYVLTAAHCILERRYEITSATLGEWKISTDPDCVEYGANIECADPAIKMKIKEIIPHPYYDKKTGHNDIGLLLLETEIQFSDYIKPICLPSPHVPSPEVGHLMTVAGWGKTAFAEQLSDVLLKVQIPLISNEQCQASMKFRETIPHQLCAGGDIKDACAGDSGGPIMVIHHDSINDHDYWYQEGVISYGVACGIRGVPAIYTQIYDYMNWIVGVISSE